MSDQLSLGEIGLNPPDIEAELQNFIQKRGPDDHLTYLARYLSGKDRYWHHAPQDIAEVRFCFDDPMKSSAFEERLINISRDSGEGSYRKFSLPPIIDREALLFIKKHASRLKTIYPEFVDIV